MKTTKKQCNSSNNNKQSLYHINNNSVESIKKNSFKEIYEFNCVIFDGTSKSRSLIIFLIFRNRRKRENALEPKAFCKLFCEMFLV